MRIDPPRGSRHPVGRRRGHRRDRAPQVDRCADIERDRPAPDSRTIGASPSLSHVSMTVSIGVASSAIAGISDGDVLSGAALRALQNAAARGGDRIVVASAPTCDDDVASEIPAAGRGEIIQLA